MGSAFYIFSPIAFVGGIVSAIITIIIGLICIAGSRYVANIAWAIILIVLGIIAGGIGGALMIIGGILGLISRLL